MKRKWNYVAIDKAPPTAKESWDLADERRKDIIYYEERY